MMEKSLAEALEAQRIAFEKKQKKEAEKREKERVEREAKEAKLLAQR